MRRSFLLVLTLALVATACAGGDGSVFDDASPTSDVPVATAAPSTDPSGDPDPPPTEAPPATTEVDSTPDTTFGFEEALDLSLVEIEVYWETTLPEVYGIDYTPIDPSLLIPADESTAIPPCGPEELDYEDVAGNAFYCAPGDLVAWDNVGLFPQLYTNYGDFTLAMVMAHEWGHRVQQLVGIFGDPSLPSVVTELQADCFSGSWTSWVDADQSENLELLPGALESGLAGLLEFRDVVGSSPTNELAHGSGFDRVNAFQEGFESGAAWCADYVNVPPPVVQQVFTDLVDLESGGDAPLGDAIELAANSLNSFWATAYVDFVPVDFWGSYALTDSDLPTCGDRDELSELELRIWYCADGNFVTWDEELVIAVYETIGDFGVAMLLSSQWAVSAQIQAGFTEDTIDTALQSDCYSGLWAAAAFLEQISYVDVSGEVVTLVLSPGDLDETVRTLLAFTDPPDESGQSAFGTAFQRVQAFRDGFLGSIDICESYTAG